MLKQIINQQARKAREANVSEDNIVQAVQSQTNIPASMVMQVLDPTKYADQIAEAQYVEQQAAQLAQEEAQRQYQAQQAAQQAAEQAAEQSAKAAAAEAEQQRQENIAKIQDIYTAWMKAPVAHNSRMFYRYVKDNFGLDATTVESAVTGQSWYLLD